MARRSTVKAGALPPLHDGPDPAIVAAVAKMEANQRKIAARQEADAAAKRLDEALHQGGRMPRRSSSTGRIADSKKPKYIAQNEGEYAKAVNIEKMARYDEDRSFSKPTITGLFRTELLTNDEDGLDVENWRTQHRGKDGVIDSELVRGAMLFDLGIMKNRGVESEVSSEPDGFPMHKRRQRKSRNRRSRQQEEEPEQQRPLEELVRTWDSWLQDHTYLI
mmetsp:Transcript_15810/g.35865  ORF Transcript_15810/g.35865 Transcript_15810/m.35865 type:complete len:220 (-) Transcript_15810:152-811(-)